MAFWITSAPDDYDYSYTKTVQEIGAVKGERGKWRVVESNDTEGRFENYQLPRYQSGMHATYPANGPDAKRMGITISTGSGRSGVSGVSKQKTTKTTLDLSMIEVVNVSDAVAWGRAIIEELKDADVVMLDTDGIAGNERTWGEMVSYLGRRNVTVKYDHDDGYPHATDASRRGVSGVSKQTRKGTRVRFVGSSVGSTHRTYLWAVTGDFSRMVYSRHITQGAAEKSCAALAAKWRREYGWIHPGSEPAVVSL